MTETYYDLLGVSRDASTDDIEDAYRDRLKETHPDVSDDEDASDRTKQLIEARDVLTDEDERARYDRLGHDQYVAVENGITGAASQESSGEATGRTGDSDHNTTRNDRSSHSTSSGSSDGTAGASSRQRRRRRTSREWDFGSDDASTGNARTDDPHSQRAPRDSWRDAGNDGYARDSDTNQAWQTWNTDGEYAFSEEDTGLHPSRLFPGTHSLVLLSATFFFYPFLLWGALFPPFPLVVKGVVGLCLLVLVAYLQSMPEIGVLVYGSWSVLLPTILLGFGVNLLAPLVLVAISATVLPFALSLLTWAVVRP